MSDIFEEVEESLSKDRWTELWKKYGIFVWMAAGLIVGSVAYVEWDRAETAKRVEANIIVFEEARTALEEGRFGEAETVFRDLTQEANALSALSGHYLAKSHIIGSGDKAAAATALEEVSAPDGNAMERLALIKAAYLKADELSVEELELFLGDLPQEPSAFGALALELIAAKAYEMGDLQRARREFGFLAISLDAPQGVTRRAQAALAVLPEPVTESVGDTAIAEDAGPVEGPETVADIDSAGTGVDAGDVPAPEGSVD